jgi:hypothetical protein
LEEQQRDGKGKQVADYPMKHLTRATKNLGIKTETLPKSSLKEGYSTDLEDDPFEAETKSEFDYFLETKLQDLQGTKVSDNVEAGEIVGSSSYKDYKHESKGENPRFSIDLNQPAPVKEHPEFRMEIRDEYDRVKELKATIRHLKQEKYMLEQWNVKQQEKLQKVKKKKKDQQVLLKEVREENIRLYWHNVVLKTKLKQIKTTGSVVII